MQKKKNTIYYWAVIFVLQFLFIAWYQGILSISLTVPPSVMPTVTPAPTDFNIVPKEEASDPQAP